MPSGIQLTNLFSMAISNSDWQSPIQTKNDRCHERKIEPPRWGVQKNQQ